MASGFEQTPTTSENTQDNTARLRVFAEECANSSGQGAPIEAVQDCEKCGGLGHQPHVHQTCSGCSGLGFSMVVAGVEITGNKLRHILEDTLRDKERHDPPAHTLH